MTHNPKFRIVLLAAVVILIALGSGIAVYNKQQYGMVLINLSLPDTKNVAATLNGKSFPIQGLRWVYKVRRGPQDLVITKPGYKKFSTRFNVGSGANSVTVSMVGATPRSTSATTTQLTASLSAVIPSNFFIKQAQYFYSNTWVVATIDNEQQNTAVLVADYIGGATGWKITLGPGTLFSRSQVVGLPPDVASYMNQQDYVDQAT